MAEQRVRISPEELTRQADAFLKGKFDAVANVTFTAVEGGIPNSNPETWGTWDRTVTRIRGEAHVWTQGEDSYTLVPFNPYAYSTIDGTGVGYSGEVVDSEEGEEKREQPATKTLIASAQEYLQERFTFVRSVRIMKVEEASLSGEWAYKFAGTALCSNKETARPVGMRFEVTAQFEESKGRRMRARMWPS